MNKKENSFIPEEWKTVAQRDWERVKRNLRDDDAEAAGFFLQQSLEKYLKAFLHLVETALTCNDIKKDVKEAQEFIQLLFPKND